MQSGRTPSRPPGCCSALAVAGDAMACVVEAAELLDVDVGVRRGVCARNGAPAREAQALSAFEPRRRQMRLTVARETPTSGCDRLASVMQAAKALDPSDDLRGRRTMQPEAASSDPPIRPSPHIESAEPICQPSWATPRLGHGLWRLPAFNHAVSFALDGAASDEHSCARSSGSPLESLKSPATSASSVRTGWTTY